MLYGNGSGDNFWRNVVNRVKALIALSALAAAGFAATAHAGGHVGVFIGGPLYYPYPVAPVPYYYAPPQVIVPAPAAPTTYVEQGQPDQSQAQAQSGGTWYYCEGSRTYYPYVKQCPGGWREVPAQPPPPSN